MYVAYTCHTSMESCACQLNFDTKMSGLAYVPREQGILLTVRKNLGLQPDTAHCSNGSYRTFYAGKFSIYEISIYSIHETLRDCLRYTWVKALHSNFFPSVQQELSPKPVAPRQWNNLYPPQFYQTNILTRFDGRGGTGLETAGLWSCTFCTFKAPKVTHWRYIRRQRICEVDTLFKDVSW